MNKHLKLGILSFLILLIVAASCVGKQKTDYIDRVTTRNTGLYEVSIDVLLDRAVAWKSDPCIDANCVIMKGKGWVVLDMEYTIPEIRELRNTGWLDIVVGDQVVCYQGIAPTNNGALARRFQFKKFKLKGSYAACDTTLDDGVTVFSNILPYENNTIYAIPRSPALVGIFGTLTLTLLEER
jgi:hypothetical protein